MVDLLSFEVVKANWQDLNELRKLDKVCFGDDAWPLWDLIAVLTMPKVVRLKAIVDGKLVGFIGGDPNENEGIGWIAILGVLPEYRRRGIAEKLLAECEQGLRFDRIRLSVRKSNEAAIQLYRKAGYQNVDLWRNYYHSGEDALVLEKRR
jgi:ribosomal protein S18 acetylase RimI-like enzyme